jgi:hypothetical protein
LKKVITPGKKTAAETLVTTEARKNGLKAESKSP